MHFHVWEVQPICNKVHLIIIFEHHFSLGAFWYVFVRPSFFCWHVWFVWYVGVERTTDPDTSFNGCAKPEPRYPTLLSAKVQIWRIANHSTYICTIHSMSSRPLWWEISENCCPIERLANNHYIPSNKPEHIEEFCHSASGKPDLDPVRISACVPDTRPDMDFLCSFQPYWYGHWSV